MKLPAWLESCTRKLQRNLHDDKKAKLQYAIAELNGQAIQWLGVDGTFGGLSTAQRFHAHTDAAEIKSDLAFDAKYDHHHDEATEIAWWRAHPIVPILTSGNNFADFPTRMD